MKNNIATSAPSAPAATAAYPAKLSHKVQYHAGTFANHANPEIQAQALRLRSGVTKLSYKAIAVELGLQCDHFAYLACHAAGKSQQGWQAVTGGRAAKLARLAAKAGK